MFPKIFPLGLETFSQLIYEDDYGAVSDSENIWVVFGLCELIESDLFFACRKASMQRPSATSPGSLTGASC